MAHPVATLSVLLTKYKQYNVITINVIRRIYGIYGKRREVGRGCWWGNLGERDPLGRSRRRWAHNIKVDFKKNGPSWSGSI
jgi:hypothetical protein